MYHTFQQNIQESKMLGGELLSSKEEGGKTSSKYFIKYVVKKANCVKSVHKVSDTSLAHVLICKNTFATFLAKRVQFEPS